MSQKRGECCRTSRLALWALIPQCTSTNGVLALNRPYLRLVGGCWGLREFWLHGLWNRDRIRLGVVKLFRWCLEGRWIGDAAWLG